MKVVFTTNIDCCKKYMYAISGYSIAAMSPNVGDLVCVFQKRDFEVWLKVVGRRWEFDSKQLPNLTCELHLQDGWSIPMLERAINGDYIAS